MFGHESLIIAKFYYFNLILILAPLKKKCQINLSQQYIFGLNQGFHCITNENDKTQNQFENNNFFLFITKLKF